MLENIFGRSEFKSILKDLYDSKVAEFAVVYGRRRIGKTFLIREFFESNVSGTPYSVNRIVGVGLLQNPDIQFGWAVATPPLPQKSADFWGP